MILDPTRGKAINLTHATNLGVRVYQPLHRSAAPPSVRDTDTPVQLYQPRSTMRRTGRLEAPSMPVSSSALAGQPAAAVVRIRAIMSRIGIAPMGTR